MTTPTSPVVVYVTVAVVVSAPVADPVNHAVGVVTRQGFRVVEAREEMPQGALFERPRRPKPPLPPLGEDRLA